MRKTLLFVLAAAVLATALFGSHPIAAFVQANETLVMVFLGVLAVVVGVLAWFSPSPARKELSSSSGPSRTTNVIEGSVTVNDNGQFHQGNIYNQNTRKDD